MQVEGFLQPVLMFDSSFNKKLRYALLNNAYFYYFDDNNNIVKNHYNHLKNSDDFKYHFIEITPEHTKIKNAILQGFDNYQKMIHILKDK